MSARATGGSTAIPVFPSDALRCAYETPYRVFDDVFCIRARNASPMAFEGTNTWIVHPAGAEACAVVDPGHDDDEHLVAIEDFVRSRGADIAEVVVTHAHPDHVAGVDSLVRSHGSRVLSKADSTLDDGAVFLCGGEVEAHAISLPGHSSDSVALLLDDDRALISGDIFFSRGWSVISSPDGDLAAYFDTLSRIRALLERGVVGAVLPGHREAMDASFALGRIDDYIEHRLKRLDEVRRAMEEAGSCDVEIVARHVYADIEDECLYEAAKMSLAAQIDYLNEKALF